MKVSELIDHLKTLPQDLDVFCFHDEFGVYVDMIRKPQVIEIMKKDKEINRERNKWLKDLYGSLNAYGT